MQYSALSKSIEYLLAQGVDVDPRVLALCPDAAPMFAKTYEYFLRNMQRLIRSVYDGNLGGDFVDIASSLIAGQLRQAYQQAWKDEGVGGEFPGYLTEALDVFVAGQVEFVEPLYKAIVDARVDETPIDGLMSRAELWAGQWNSGYSEAVRLITVANGGKMIWKLGQTERHCLTCSALNGITAYASEWDALGVHPKEPENPVLVCGGWHCDCVLSPTDKRRTPKAYDRILNAVTR